VDLFHHQIRHKARKKGLAVIMSRERGEVTEADLMRLQFRYSVHYERLVVGGNSDLEERLVVAVTWEGREGTCPDPPPSRPYLPRF
jgi:hypothetical protein